MWVDDAKCRHRHGVVPKTLLPKGRRRGKAKTKCPNPNPNPNPKPYHLTLVVTLTLTPTPTPEDVRERDDPLLDYRVLYCV